MRLISAIILISLQGCAYTVASTASFVTTGKSLSDHAASTLTQADCNTYSFATNKQDYLCERARTVDSTYNRNPF